MPIPLSGIHSLCFKGNWASGRFEHPCPAPFSQCYWDFWKLLPGHMGIRPEVCSREGQAWSIAQEVALGKPELIPEESTSIHPWCAWTQHHPRIMTPIFWKGKKSSSVLTMSLHSTCKDCESKPEPKQVAWVASSGARTWLWLLGLCFSHCFSPNPGFHGFMLSYCSSRQKHSSTTRPALKRHSEGCSQYHLWSNHFYQVNIN